MGVVGLIPSGIVSAIMLVCVLQERNANQQLRGRSVDAPKAGQRLRCTKCGTEVVVIKAPDRFPECCGQALEDLSRKG